MVDTRWIMTKKKGYNKAEKVENNKGRRGEGRYKKTIARRQATAAKLMLTSTHHHYETAKESGLSLITYTKLM